ncbi:Ig-like domain repeat protein [Mumia sp. zg.B21]|uniref:Ig-like domain-containing protein n=1 Tax=Mumia sp. zg.B21 TaxID=2855447 RepID=UPI001C6EE2E8|nr:Ig-like domain repeat protein [Mumia sp. zg.B21]MBW9209530.1 Ig-like domain repeat protein [Mumia sp. zg.B21]
MPTLRLNAPSPWNGRSGGSFDARRLVAALVAVLLAVGVLAASPAKAEQSTLSYNGWTEAWADSSLWVSFTVTGDVTTGTMTAAFDGKTVTLEPVEGSDAVYAGSVPGPLTVGTGVVTATFTPTTGGPVTGSGSVVVRQELRYPGPAPAGAPYDRPNSAFVWGVSDTLRATVAAEGGSVTLSGGAVRDPRFTDRFRFPITDMRKAYPARIQAGGVVRLASPRREVVVSDLEWVTQGMTGELRADVTYRHPGQTARTEKGIALASVAGLSGGGEPAWSQAIGETRATVAGARVLGVAAGADLGPLIWTVYYSATPFAATARMTVTPAVTTYGRAARVGVSVARGATYAAGTVALTAGSRSLGTVRLSRGAATVAVPAGLAVGTHQIIASYRADFSPTTAAVRTAVRITKAGTDTKVRLSKKKVTRKQRAKVTVTVTGRGTAIRPTGTVTVFNGKKRVGRATLTAARRGAVTVTLPRLKKRGKHTLRIVYGGSSAFTGSSARAVLRVR